MTKEKDENQRTTCGTIVTDGKRILIGHSTGNKHWDIPKGMADQGESHLDAAVRELEEETGIVTERESLVDLGSRPYLPGKRLSPFLLRLDPLPEPTTLSCRSMVSLPGKPPFPEMDAFALVPIAEVGKFLTKRMTDILLSEEIRNHLAFGERNEGEKTCE
jgi:8-oxo-dGTP pyrophosphatase MutT (NUDIX family)